MKTRYTDLGVSHGKEEVYDALAVMPRGLYADTFCQVSEDLLGDERYCTLMHADGAGTKSVLAYLWYRETGDAAVFRGIAQDAAVMNTDDLLCAGAVDDFYMSNTIGRNARLAGVDVLRELMAGYVQFARDMEARGIRVVLTGGETADVGDLVATVIADAAAFTRLRRDRLIRTSAIRPGDAIVGLASDGQAAYERQYNSGIGSNGLTAARHLLLSPEYAERYPESYSATTASAIRYGGTHKLADPLPGTPLTVGEALLSPTRTYLPVVREMLASEASGGIHGIVHCSGGGQAKIKRFGRGLHYVKDDLFRVPPVFRAIQATGNVTEDEMYRVFNMGHRLEICCAPEAADRLIAISREFGVEAKRIGRVEASATGENRVTVVREGRTIEL